MGERSFKFCIYAELWRDFIHCSSFQLCSVYCFERFTGLGKIDNGKDPALLSLALLLD